MPKIKKRRAGGRNASPFARPPRVLSVYEGHQKCFVSCKHFKGLKLSTKYNSTMGGGSGLGSFERSWLDGLAFAGLARVLKQGTLFF